MLQKANNSIGKDFENCAYAACHIAPQYSKLLLEYANPDSKNFNRKEALSFASSSLTKIEKPKNGALACFLDVRGIFGHVGIYINGYIYHYQNEYKMLSVNVDTILDKSKYKEIKYYISEDINDNN